MRHSVRVRFVGWLQGIGDDVVQHIAKMLRVGEVHPQAGRDGDESGIVGVDDHGGEGKKYDTVSLPAFRDYLDKLRRSPIIANVPPVAAYGDLTPARNYDLGSGPPGRNFLINAHDYNSCGVGKSYLNSQSMGESTPGCQSSAASAHPLSNIEKVEA